MPKYLAIYYETKRFERVIEARDIEEAEEIAMTTDDDVVEDNKYLEWELEYVREISDKDA